MTIQLDITAAEAAISRLDDGTATAQDRQIADIFDRHSSDYWHRLNTQTDRYNADRCVICGRTGEGPECDSCAADHDFAVARAADL